LDDGGLVVNAAFLKDLAIVAQPILFGIIVFLYKGRARDEEKRKDDMQTKVDDLVVSVAIIKNDVENVRDNVSMVAGEMRALRPIQEDVAVLKRDLKTAWRQIETLRNN
jgi:cadmium resistance protein CadD (predicted permease)